MQHRWTTDSLYERCAPEPMSGCWLWEGYARQITPHYLQPEGSYKGKTVAYCAQHLGITAKAMSRLFNGRSERR